MLPYSLRNSFAYNTLALEYFDLQLAVQVITNEAAKIQFREVGYPVQNHQTS